MASTIRKYINLGERRYKTKNRRAVEAFKDKTAKQPGDGLRAAERFSANQGQVNPDPLHEIEEGMA
ncbi:MAG: hypothetical protein ACUVRM_11250 [Bacillota bacterium]